MTWTRRLILLTAAVATAALLLQLILVIDGASVLVEKSPPGLWTRIGRYLSYFTIQSNLLVAIGCWMLVRNPRANGAWFRFVWLAALIGITVTGIVHFTLLRPLLDLSGWSWVADKALHMVAPVLAILSWILGGPRGRIDRPAVTWSVVWPLAWLGWTLAVAGLTTWVPYPFLNFRTHGWGSVTVACLGVLVLYVALLFAANWSDRRLQRR